MPLSYAKNKKHIYAWVEKNKDRKNEITLKCMRKKRMLCCLIKTYNVELANEIMRLLNIEY